MADPKAPLMEIIPMSTDYDPSQHVAPNISPSPRKQSLRLRVKELANQFWIWEALSCLVAAIFYLAIMVELKRHDHTSFGSVSDTKTAGQRKAKAPIFPILSFLSAIMKAAMLMPVASAISQSKWLWFRKERKLAHIDRFDEASRGVMGSIRLLFTVRLMHFAAIGAILTILALPMDAVIQTSVQIREKLVLNERVFNGQNIPKITNTTFVSRTSRFTANSTQTMTTPENPWPASNLVNAMKFGISYTVGLQDIITGNFLVECPTGYCEYGQYQTLGIAHECIDISAKVVSSADGMNYTLPGTNLTLFKTFTDDHPQGLVVATTTTKANENSFPDSGPTIVRTMVLVNTFIKRPGGPVALECGLFWSVKTYRGSVNEDTSFLLSEKLVPNITTNWAFDRTLNRMVGEPEECWVNNTILTNTSSFYEADCKNQVSPRGWLAMENLMLDEQDGMVGESVMYDENHFSKTNHFITNVYELSLRKNQTRFAASFDTMMSNIALAMTHTMRNTDQENPDRSENPQLVVGDVYDLVFYYHIMWIRMALPTLLVFGSIIFFILTALMNHNGETWKRSSLPLLFHGLGTPERISAGEPITASEMLDVAKNMKVRLAMTSEGMRMVRD